MIDVEKTLVQMLMLSLVSLFDYSICLLVRLYTFLYISEKNFFYIFLNFSYVKSDRDVLSSQIKQVSVLISDGSLHAINYT